MNTNFQSLKNSGPLYTPTQVRELATLAATTVVNEAISNPVRVGIYSESYGVSSDPSGTADREGWFVGGDLFMAAGNVTTGTGTTAKLIVDLKLNAGEKLSEITVTFGTTSVVWSGTSGEIYNVSAFNYTSLATIGVVGQTSMPASPSAPTTLTLPIAGSAMDEGNGYYVVKTDDLVTVNINVLEHDGGGFATLALIRTTATLV